MKKRFFIVAFLCFLISTAQTKNVLYDIIDNTSSKRLENDIRKLADFGTRHTLSDTLSETRGIGAARRWIKSQFETISNECSNCLEVFYQKNYFTPEDGDRIVKPVWINNVVAIQRGKTHPNRFIIMSGDIDSRISDPTNYKDDSPGANDNASGMAGTIEAARVLSNYTFENSIVYVGLAGEEQGLFGGKGLAKYVNAQGWEIIGILNNDMIGNIKGQGNMRGNKTPT